MKKVMMALLLVVAFTSPVVSTEKKVEVPGLPFGSSTKAVDSFATKLGFSKRNITSTGIVSYDAGQWATYHFSFVVFGSCQPVGMHTLKVFIPVDSSNYQQKYDELVSLYRTKYGEPSNEFRFFKSPYKDGDGYEYQAVRVGKGSISTYWEDENANNLGIAVDDGGIDLPYQDSKRFSVCKEQSRNQSLNNI